MNKTHNKQVLRFDLLDKEKTQAIAVELLSKLKEGMTLQDATGISADSLEEVYCLAYSYYNQGKYKESISLFHLLAGASPKTYKYVLGLASSFHQLEHYEDAAAGFYIAFNIEPNNPVPAYYITDCFLKLSLLEEAKEFSKVTIMACEGRPEFQDLKNRCELIQKSLSI